MEVHASKRRGRGSAGGTGVGVAPGPQWGLRKAGSRCWANEGIMRSRHRRASGCPRFRCCPVRCVARGWAPRRVAGPRYVASWPRAAAGSGAGDRRPTGPLTRARPDPAKDMLKISLFYADRVNSLYRRQHCWFLHPH